MSGGEHPREPRQQRRESPRIGSALSTDPDSEQAARALVTELRATLEAPRPGVGVDLVFAFLTPEHLERAAAVAAILREELAARHIVGCVSQGVIGRDRELEQGPGLAAWAACLPGAAIETFHLTADPETGIDATSVPDLEDAELAIVLADPFGFPAHGLLDLLNEEHPGVPLVGGLATGAGRADTQALIVDDDVKHEGAVGAILRDVAVAVAVSQGCAPIGREAVVTDAESNLIRELAGEPALERLQAEFAELTEREQKLASQGVLAGLVIDENKPAYERGDFLMRGVLGVDQDSGAIAVGESVRVGQTVRFHVRDAMTASEDLEAAIAQVARDGRAASGALLFTCNGRGSHMFGVPDHDAGAISGALASDALAGMFCGGEIGPVGTKNFLHGFTATTAVFLEPAE